jgi:hypothetical protein
VASAEELNPHIRKNKLKASSCRDVKSILAKKFASKTMVNVLRFDKPGKYAGHPRYKATRNLRPNSIRLRTKPYRHSGAGRHDHRRAAPGEIQLIASLADCKYRKK